MTRPMKATRAQRATVRRLGGFEDRSGIIVVGGVRAGGSWLTRRERLAVLAVLNEIAAESPEVAKTRDALLRACEVFANETRRSDALTLLGEAAIMYVRAKRATSRGKKVR